MRTYQQLGGKCANLFEEWPSKLPLAGTYIFVENIEIWISTPLVLSMETTHIKHLKRFMKRDHFFRSMLSHYKAFNALTREHIQHKD